MTRNYKQLYALLSKHPGLHQYKDTSELKADLVNAVSGGRTTSASELNDNEYRQLIGYLNEPHKSKKDDMDKLRKRVLASMFGFFKLIDKPVSIDYVKAIAVRAAGSDCKSFNYIGETRLRAIYNEFRRQQEVVKNIGREQAIMEMSTVMLALCGVEIRVKKPRWDC